ncbi:MAG: trypsin-like serine protease [Rhodobacter sp.]|nr:trypsin-like serine protease [Rhodobacter sp.]
MTQPSATLNSVSLSLVLSTTLALPPAAVAFDLQDSPVVLIQFGGGSGLGGGGSLGNSGSIGTGSIGTGNLGSTGAATTPSIGTLDGPGTSLVTDGNATITVPPLTGGTVPTQPFSFDNSVNIPGFTDTGPGDTVFPDLGGFPDVPLTSGGPLPPIEMPTIPPRDPGDFAAHCGVTMVCGGDPAGPVTGPTVAPTSGTRVAGVDALPGESAKTEAGLNEKGSFASRVNRLSFPTTVALQYSDRVPKCSGVLVSEEHVLTAAHCTCGERALYAYFGETLVPARVRGRGLRTSVPLTSRATYFDDGFCAAFDKGTAYAEGHIDLALLTLDSSLPGTLAAAILPVDPLSDLETEYPTSYIVGFGESDNRFRPGDKNFASIDLTARLCKDGHETCIPGKEIVAADPPVDTCFGDSGGPMFLQETTGDEMELAGITSRSFKPRDDGDPLSCGEGGIYVSLEAPEIRAWLRAQIDSNN